MNFGTGGEIHSPLFFHQEDSLTVIAAGPFFSFSLFLSMVFAKFIWGFSPLFSSLSFRLII